MKTFIAELSLNFQVELHNHDDHKVTTYESLSIRGYRVIQQEDYPRHGGGEIVSKIENPPAAVNPVLKFRCERVYYPGDYYDGPGSTNLTECGTAFMRVSPPGYGPQREDKHEGGWDNLKAHLKNIFPDGMRCRWTTVSDQNRGFQWQIDDPLPDPWSYEWVRHHPRWIETQVQHQEYLRWQKEMMVGKKK
ncbi:MAG: hypothetical protein V4509_01200 [Patescibacteria group bacterium]